MTSRPSRFWSQDVEDRAVTAGLLLAVTIVGAQTIVQLINSFALDARYHDLDPDWEYNLWSWTSASATFGCAFAAMIVAVVSRRRASLLGVLAVLLLYLSLDDAILLHERIGHKLAVRLGLETYGDRLLQPALFLPIVAVVFVLLLLVARGAPRRAARSVYVGLALLVVGVLAEVIARAAELDPPEAADYIEVAVEEGAELGGWILVAGGLTAMALREMWGALAKAERT